MRQNLRRPLTRTTRVEPNPLPPGRPDKDQEIALRFHVCAGSRGAQKEQGMTPRTTTVTSVAGRSIAMRRQRRRTANANRPMCSTNGCPTYLTVDPRTGVANCEICGYTRRPH